jgi:molybdopterin-guanine dinucleotide biosynthesis protein B
VIDSRISPPPLLGIAGYSGSGKTTLLVGLLPILRRRGLRVAVVKRTHHEVEMDQPGKDSHSLRHAGAGQVLLASSGRWALMVEREPGEEPSPEQWAARLPPGEQDLVLFEGYKAAPIPKLEVHRPSVGKPLLCSGDPWIRAVASDAALDLPEGVTLLHLDDHESIAAWLLCQAGLLPSGSDGEG